MLQLNIELNSQLIKENTVKKTNNNNNKKKKQDPPIFNNF